MQYGEEYLDLVEPTGVYRSVDLYGIRVPVSKPLHRTFAAMGGTIISNPEDSMCRPIRFLSHDQIDQLVVSFYTGRSLADPEELGSVDIPSGNIGQGPFSFVFELHASWVMQHGASGDSLSVASLDTGLFVGADHVVIWPQRNTIEESIIQVQNAGSLFCEKRVARKKPAVMAPRLYGITVEPTPDRSNANTTMPRTTASLAISAVLRREKGSPSVLGSSQAKALISTML